MIRGLPTSGPPAHASARAASGARLRQAARVGVGAALGAAWIALSPGLAAAHIEPAPKQIGAGQTATVALQVEHGCDGSPTTKVAVAVPEGVTDMRGVAKPGWTVQDAADAVTFTGGPLDGHTGDHFDVTFTAPATVGDLHLPVVQTCEQGELAWISIAQPGEEEPDQPAPTVEVVAGGAAPATPGTTAAGGTAAGAAVEDHEDGDDHGDGSASTISAEAASATTAVATAGSDATTLTATNEQAAAEEGDDAGTDAGPIIIGAIGVVAVGAGVLLLLRRRAGGGT